MRYLRNIVIVAFCALFCVQAHAQAWSSHFAYNNVTQIAMTPDRVYAVSDGSLFSVDKQTEQLQTYNRQSGLHGTNITCIAYDAYSDMLLIAYEAGRLDLMYPYGVQYIGDLYDKDMTQEKTIHNITIHGRTAYFATHYGVQVFDLRRKIFTDSYWLRPGGEETPIKDVLLANDSIYAFSDDSLYCAWLHDNIVDYHFWNREPRSSRIQPDSEKGTHIVDGTDEWFAGGEEGIVRESATEHLAYKPEGPLVNVPYRLHCDQGRLYVFQGGRWDNSYRRPAMVMIYDGEHWTNIPTQPIADNVPTTKDLVYDFMNVAVDPNDRDHYWITSYGTGLYEFNGTSLTKRYLPAEDNTLESAVPTVPARYTRMDFAKYDSDGNMWILQGSAGMNPLICLDANGQWRNVPLIYNAATLPLHTPGGLIFDFRNPNFKWIATARANTGLFLLDDNGTRFDASDDRLVGRNEWQMPSGQPVTADEIYAILQSSDGRIWIGCDKGIVIIDAGVDYFESNLCVRPDIMDNNGENPMTSMPISALCEDKEGNIWAGTNTLGVYVLNSEATEILAHFTTENSSMPSNTVLSLACNERGVMYVGTGGGLVQYDPYSSPTGVLPSINDEGRDMGTMQQWRLHNSYEDAEEVVSTASRIYALAHGALYYVDRATDQIEYLSKASGLNGSTISHIAYDASAQQLIIAYEDGRIDLLADDDDVRQMPDLQMKASSVSVAINTVTVGNKNTYVGTPFGILTINTKKAEISDTYYIGEEAKDVDVKHIAELGDSLYAFTDDFVYSASLKDNLVDYTYWHESALPNGKVQNAFVYHDRLYMLQDNVLYRLEENRWQKVSEEKLQWVHASGGQMLTYISGNGLYHLSEAGELAGITGQYVVNDAVYTNGEYWLAESGSGLIRLSSASNEAFYPQGPNSNSGYYLTIAHGQLYSVAGGRWASQYMNEFKLNIFDGTNWRKYTGWDVYARTNCYPWDPVSVAVDPKDAGHFFVATYTAGVIEFRNYEVYARYNVSNSTIRQYHETFNPDYYTRTDGAMVDAQGNFWVLNSTEIADPIHILSPNGQWHSLPLRDKGQNALLITPSGILTDRRNSHRKWLLDQRATQGVFLLDDGGTPTDPSDDRSIKRESFVDQNGNQLNPTFVFCIAQDHTNRMWIGTEKGLIIIPAANDFFATNACRRIIIPRNDGTGLGDYLLGEEQINCLAVDGGNRMWIGTETSGLYLIEDDTITVAHFTEDNSLLPSNQILSIAIEPRTGEVFVGTGKGIASYRSDASEPMENMSSAYAYPNPVRPDYGGMISICGLMDNTVVNIVDAGGNLVCKTRSNGGTAVWDGRSADGRRVTSGVYTALCNAESGHTVVKILFIQ